MGRGPVNTFQRDLLDEWDSDFRKGSEAVFDKYEQMVQKDPDTPRDTGKLAAGIVQQNLRTSVDRATVDIVSTRKSSSGADVGTILDQSTGRVVKASDYGRRAFGPFSGTRGPRTFTASFRVTTAHVGWWEKVNGIDTWNAALTELDRYNL